MKTIAIIELKNFGGFIIMALDGIAAANIKDELKSKLLNGRIDKVYQPENDEIILSIRSLKKAYKLLITANASNPRIHLTEKNKLNPMQPPLFCMVLRKHLASGKIIDITQPNFERILNIHIESINELGDYSIKRLIIEIMGKHSNIILVDENGIILDAVKHISHEKSSVREVLPGKEYRFPPSEKYDTLLLDEENFNFTVNKSSSKKLQNLIYESYNGISPSFASEICFRAGLDSSDNVDVISDNRLKMLYNEFKNIVEKIKTGNFSPEIIYSEKNKIIDFSSMEMSQYSGLKKQKFSSISELLEFFYTERDLQYRMNQKSQDLKKIIANNIERCIKKKNIQIKTMKEISGRDRLKLYGELITANIYSVPKGTDSYTTQNFYDKDLKDITIPLDPELTPSENAQKFFKQYNKEKRTFSALQTQIKQNDEELEYLEGLLTSVQVSTDEQNIKEIRQELYEQGFIKKLNHPKGKIKPVKSKPLHYISSDGFNIYVGKNNRQNDELTLKFAKNTDIWLHTKKIPGSHVIISAEGKEIPDNTLNEAALLAAFYSKGKNSALVPVDYTPKKFVKKPSGAKPGMVIYETNKTAYITPTEEAVQKIKKVD